MKDALLRLFEDEMDCCFFFRAIIDRMLNSEGADSHEITQLTNLTGGHSQDTSGLNPSQQMAVQSCRKPLSLIWGPPGLLISYFPV